MRTMPRLRLLTLEILASFSAACSHIGKNQVSFFEWGQDRFGVGDSPFWKSC